MEAGERARSNHLTLLQRLATAPETFHLFQALRVLEAAYPGAPRLGESRRPRQDRIRIEQEAELAFPTSGVAAFTLESAEAPATVTNRFFGLFGPNGPLPIHLTEYARDRSRNHHDRTFLAFANMLSHRLASLFYRAYTTGQPAPSFDRPDADPVERKVAALSGYMGEALARRDEMPDLAKRYFAGHLSAGPRNAEGLVSILSNFFGAPVHIRQFVGCWLELEPGDRWQLGARAGLGRATSIGTKVWSRSAKFRILIGPLTLAEYRRLLPGSKSLARIDAIVRNYAGDVLDWDVNLLLRADQVPKAILGRDTRLGHTSWIGTRAADAGPADELYLTPKRRT